jgi:hypothetical protein
MSIRGSTEFLRIFANRDFEVGGSSETLQFKTLHPLNGYYYEFKLCPDSNRLTIIECDVEQNIKVELIPVAEIITIDNDGLWATDLPIGLLQGHSHWLCSERGLVLIRPIPFQDKKIKFLVDLATEYCYRIKRHEQNLPLSRLFDGIGATDQFMEVPLSIRLVLEKFEEKSFIHSIYDHALDRFQLELPRYSLEFYINSDGELQSSQYRGFLLCLCQTWKALPFWSQYLIIENAELRSKKILAPDGLEVKATEHGYDQIRYILDTDPFIKIPVFVYDFHSVFSNCLGATSLESRLNLAIIFVAAGTDCPGI